MPGNREDHMAKLMRLSEKTQTDVGIDTLFSKALATVHCCRALHDAGNGTGLILD